MLQGLDSAATRATRVSEVINREAFHIREGASESANYNDLVLRHPDIYDHMPYLEPSHWRIDTDLLRDLSGAWVGDYLMLEVFEQAMTLLQRHLRDGSIYHHALNLCAQYPLENPSHPSFGYAEFEMEALLRHGEFMYCRASRYYSSDGICPELKITDLAEQYKPWAIGLGYPGEPHIEIAWSYFPELANEQPEVFSNDSAGRDRLSWELAGLVLHEVVHNHGFLHPGFDETQQTFTAVETRETEYDPRREYYRTLPCIAERAVYLVAEECFSGTGYDRAKSRRWPVPCGCRLSNLPRHRGPQGGKAVDPNQSLPNKLEPVHVRRRGQ